MALVDSEDLELVNDSLERCTPQAEFFEQFYERFRGSSEEIAARFAGTDAKTQARALRTAFLVLLQAIAGDPAAWQQLELRAIRHDRRHLDIKPEMYELWKESLVDTVRDFDPRADARTEQAWRKVVQQATEFMTARY